MPLYEVLEDSYINDRIVKAGSIIDYTPPPAAKKVPAGASDEEKAKPEYQATVVGKNLKLARQGATEREIPAEVVTRPGD